MNIFGNILVYTILALLGIAITLCLILLIRKLIRWIKKKRKNTP